MNLCERFRNIGSCQWQRKKKRILCLCISQTSKLLIYKTKPGDAVAFVPTLNGSSTGPTASPPWLEEIRLWLTIRCMNSISFVILISCMLMLLIVICMIVI